MIPKSGNRIAEKIMPPRNICVVAHDMDAAHHAGWEKLWRHRGRICGLRASGARVG
jgi:hypothetical protein